jgi:hypothetical protein
MVYFLLLVVSVRVRGGGGDSYYFYPVNCRIDLGGVIKINSKWSRVGCFIV